MTYHPTPSPPLRWHGPQVVHSGLRTDDPIFRIDLSPPLPTHAKEAQLVYRQDFDRERASRHTRWPCAFVGLRTETLGARAGEVDRRNIFSYDAVSLSTIAIETECFEVRQIVATAFCKRESVVHFQFDAVSRGTAPYASKMISLHYKESLADRYVAAFAWGFNRAILRFGLNGFESNGITGLH